MVVPQVGTTNVLIHCAVSGKIMEKTKTVEAAERLIACKYDASEKGPEGHLRCVDECTVASAYLELRRLVSIVKELSPRNDDESYRAAVIEILASVR
jgi:hypothetical protein